MNATVTATGTTSACNVDGLPKMFTCTTCNTDFESNLIRREHMKEDWHVYNLRRRITDLPPISLPVFQAQIEAQGEINSKKRSSYSSTLRKSCGACRRRYTDLEAWQTHLKSQHHIQSVSSAGSITSEKGSFDEFETGLRRGQEEEERFSPSHCLFCNLESSDLEDNLAHMSHAHSFFIPDIDHLFDVESFLGYLFSIIAEFNECLFCESVRNTKVAVQDHMRGKGHCRLNFENEQHQLHQFYDSDYEEDEEDEKTNEAVELEGDELRLPSGRVLGHRSKARYFRQHHSKESSGSELTSSLHPPPLEPTNSESENLPAKSTERQLVMRAGTSTSIVGLSDLQQRALRAVEKKIIKTETRVANEYQHVLDKGGNKQKTYKVAGIGKKQGGLEKRLG